MYNPVHGAAHGDGVGSQNTYLLTQSRYCNQYLSVTTYEVTEIGITETIRKVSLLNIST